MPYFPVDDQMSFHPKVVAAGNAAIGVWTRAGAWSKGHVTGGFIPTEIASTFGLRESKRLVSVGLWVEVSGGFQFHDWDHQAGNADAETEKARRERERERNRVRKQAQREREKGHGEGHGEGHAVTPAPVTLTPSPSPSPRQTDVTHLPSHVTEVDVREGDDDQLIRAWFAEIGQPSSQRRVLAAIRGVLGPISAAECVDVAAGLLDLSLTHVRFLAAYIEKACTSSPDEVRDVWARIPKPPQEVSA